MPAISVIILNWNGKHFLDDCLNAMRRQTFRDFETILVDNGSTDGSAEYVREHFPDVRLIALSDNRGFPGGNIAGYEQAEGDLIVLLNNDTEADPAWLEQIYQASIRYPEVSSFASKMMYFDDRQRIENCGFDLGIECATRDRGRDELDGPAWGQDCPVFGACAGAGAYRRSMLQEIGFLDPDFFVSYEDVDLSFRAQLFGYSCVYVSQAVVYHRYRATRGKAPFREAWYSQRNIEYVWLKNMPGSLLLRYFPQRILYEVGSALYFARRGAATAFLGAKWRAFRDLPSLFRKRREIQRRKTISNAQLRAMMAGSVFASKWRKLRNAGNR